MAISKKAVIDNIGYDVAGSGEIAVRVAKLTYEDDTLVAREPHRFLLEAGDDIDLMVDRVNADLDLMGFGAMDAAGIDAIKADAEQLWTDERIAVVTQRREAERGAAEEAARVQQEQAAAAAQAETDARAEERATLKAEILAELAQQP